MILQLAFRSTFFFEQSLSDSLSLATPLHGPPGPKKRKRQRGNERERPLSLVYAVWKHVLG